MEASEVEPERIDPIPPHLKEYFFADKSPPDFAKDYEVLGFDADHCLVKYNVKNLSQLMYKALAEDLVNTCGYPEELLDISPESHGIGLNNAVWDIENNLIVRLVEGKVVTRAYRGFKQLTDTEVVEVYGDPPVMSWLNYPEV